MSALRQLLKSVFAAALPQSWLMTHGPRAAVSQQQEIALTFDDGPHPEHTPRLLDALAAAGAKGTFFVIGEQTLRHPNLVRRIADEGHEIGNHTWTHSEPAQTSAVRFLEEVTQTRQMIQNLTGRDCRMMRPPKGALTVGKTLGLWRRQQTIALWNSDPKDYAMTDEIELLRWLDGYRPRTGDIVLLHDNHPRAAVAVERLTRHDLRFVTLSEWLDRSCPVNVAESLRDSNPVLGQLCSEEAANVR